MASFKQISEHMKRLGANRIIFKALANNDNSKQQIYLGSDFEVIQAIPSGEIFSDGVSKKGPIFKAPLKLYWINEIGHTDQAPNAQIILYPKYPEIRMSGFIQNTNKALDIAPRHLMLPPTQEERLNRITVNRYLILGVNQDTIFAYCTSWDDEVSNELKQYLIEEKTQSVASVFHEIRHLGLNSEEKLLQKLKNIYMQGPIESCRLKANGNCIPYHAQNGAGYTLEAQFGITPNGNPEPDFMDWELKSHSKSVVTLMTPEPNIGIYIDDGLKTFLQKYGTNIKSDRMDFASSHRVDEENKKTLLTLQMEGYDSKSGKITDPEGGLILRDSTGNIAAGWKFNKIIEHWKKKHSNTCYVHYTPYKTTSIIQFHFGPLVTLAQGTSFEHFLRGLNTSIIYYDPGVKMELINEVWKPKKRNQFRVKWKDIEQLYSNVKSIDLNDI